RRRRPQSIATPWLLAGLLAACAGADLSTRDPEAVLAEAEQALREERPAAALELLEGIDEETLPFRLGDRHALAQATALYATGEVWDAYEVTEQFADRYPHSERRSTIAELEWQIARTLQQSGRSFLFFYSERRGARAVLEHLITRHPDSPRVPDALRVLGDMAFEDEQYELAQERFRDIMRRYPESEWRVYASFRFAMAIVAGLQGPDYDLDQMEHASRELRDFLAGNPENPDFVAEATTALERLRQWRAERHLAIAEFYHRVRNPAGRRLHLEYAADAEFAGTAAQQAAASELAALGAEGGK
ncbi:MAG: outer membrane protein assembly factor BamD, partial [Planctomycetes bacterium]|nr:outer membrane protein assembly factor BamD [Planctomycetota bacterium]